MQHRRTNKADNMTGEGKNSQLRHWLQYLCLLPQFVNIRPTTRPIWWSDVTVSVVTIQFLCCGATRRTVV